MTHTMFLFFNTNKNIEFFSKQMTSNFVLKYKPHFIDEFFTNHETTHAIRTLIEMNEFNVLFVGSSGSGKTTLLYALMREYYNFGKTFSIPENDVMMVNNLKEQGLNYFRTEMKTFCQSKCTKHGKKKMIIIDDLDGINEQNQQVFRNFIDKYKNNVFFVAVCTNLHNVIECLQSRLHILSIPCITHENMIVVMEKIIKQENMIVDEPSKKYIVQHSNNNVRILINNLEKMFILGEPVTIELCEKMCSNISFSLFNNYLILLKEGKMTESMTILYDLHSHGYSVIDIFDFFFTFIKKTDLLEEEKKYEIISLLCKYITIFHSVHENEIELALFTADVHVLLNSSPFSISNIH